MASVTGYYSHQNNNLNWIFLVAVLICLYLTTSVNYLLFHSLVELFSIIVAAAVFIITWNSIKYIKNPYLVIVGISYLFIGFLDLLHTISYKGMPIFTDYDFYANQLWIAARYMESCTLLAAFYLLFAKKNIKAGFVFVFYLLVTILLIASIFYWKNFPVCFIAGIGLTGFKIYSEYIICTILVASIVLLARNRSLFNDSVYRYLLFSMVFAIGSELSFTFYTNNYGISNLVGHYLKLFSFMMIYQAIVATGIEEPYHLIFNDLSRVNDHLRDEIELRQQTEVELKSEFSERKQVEDTLRESEERLRLLGNNLPDSALFQYVLEPDGSARFQYFSAGIERLNGISVQDVLRDAGELYRQIPPEYLENLTKAEARSARDLSDLDMEVPMRRADGQMRWMRLRSRPRRLANGLVIWDGVQTDITERKQAREQIDKLNEELEYRVEKRTEELAVALKTLQCETAERLQALEVLREKEQMLIQQSRQAAMGEMIGNIAHQWRQPLNTLALFTQSLGLFYGTPQFNKEFLDTSVAKSMKIIQHMSKTIDDFKDYFKPEKEKCDFCVREVVNNTLTLLDGSFQNPNICINIVEKSDPVINGYKNEFAQVLLNILANARDAIIERGINDGRVIITICNEDACAVVTISDNAGGIPEEFINKVFDPYFSTKGPKQGTGVGLFMSKNIIEKNMGGRLVVRNTEIGAEFRIEVGDEPGN